MRDDPVATCPACGAAAARQFFPAGIVFKGSGFYKTDSRGAASSSITSDSSDSGKSTATPAKTEFDQVRNQVRGVVRHVDHQHQIRFDRKHQLSTMEQRLPHHQETHMSHPITVTDTTFKEEVLDSAIPVLVDFWASWCTPCKMIAPIVEEFATQYDGQVKVAKVDVDANPITPGMFGIMSIPTLMIFRGGKAEERIVGYQPKQALEAKLLAVLAAA